jgi:cysteine desulfurase
MIYLDHNATTPIDPRVAEAIADCYAAGYLNPASPHAAGRRARQRLEQARETIARILGADTARMNSAELLFTSGGTESNNLALRGLAYSPTVPKGPRTRIIVSAIEHPSILGTAQQMLRQGYDVRQLPVDSDGVVQISKLDELITDETRLVSVMWANNETGVIQPIAEIAAICRERGVLMHTDAVQLVGKLPVAFDELGVDALSLTAHKFHGPLGIGALLLRGGVQLQPILYGGFQQHSLRPGTESVALAVGLQRALELWRDESPERAEKLRMHRDRLENLLRAGYSDLVINGIAADRLPHCSNVSFPGCDRQALLLALDQAGVCCSTGSACASGSSEPSPVLLAMGCSEQIVEGSLRISVGKTTTTAEIDLAAQIILELRAKLTC